MEQRQGFDQTKFCNTDTVNSQWDFADVAGGQRENWAVLEKLVLIQQTSSSRPYAAEWRLRVYALMSLCILICQTRLLTKEEHF